MLFALLIQECGRVFFIFQSRCEHLCFSKIYPCERFAPRRLEGDTCLKSDIRFTARTYSATSRRACLAALLLFATLLCSAQSSNQPPKKKHQVQPTSFNPHPVVARVIDSRVAPLPSGDGIVSYHAPYDAGDCSICHQNNDVKNPGPVKGSINDLCLGCHDDFRETLARKYSHPPSQQSCLNCHNPHDSKQPKLLLEESATLCLSCHQQIKDTATKATVKHDALTQGNKCVNCHNPHGANVEHLLVQLPMQLCLQCHGKNDVADHDGKKLTNMKALLANNPHQHGPVAAQDCDACHMPHGGNNFRLLTNAYPPLFYAPYDSQNYALCFGCHEEKAFTAPQTEELTQFRDGSKNLHYIHVNKSVMGRTCRACHEVHASVQDHQIREAVPFGPKAWMLKINYSKTETGGSCAKTCHATRSYNNSRPKASASVTETKP
jgi:predicted CXXCH cytochrome family protein